MIFDKRFNMLAKKKTTSNLKIKNQSVLILEGGKKINAQETCN